MSDNVIQFKPRPKPDNTTRHVFTIDVNEDGSIENLSLWMPDGGDRAEVLKLNQEILFRALWWVGRDIRDCAPDDPMGLLAIVMIHEGSRVNCYSAKEEEEDAFIGKERLAWLGRRLADAYQLLQPSWSEGQHVSGTISLSHSANIGPTPSSSSTTSEPSTTTE